MHQANDKSLLLDHIIVNGWQHLPATDYYIPCPFVYTPSGPTPTTVFAVTEQPFSETWQVRYRLSDTLPNVPAAAHFKHFLVHGAGRACRRDDPDGRAMATCTRAPINRKERLKWPANGCAMD